jgi:hypothetical protein
MKVFWSWQSDTPGQIGRFFVRDALEAAIKDLKKEVELEVPERAEGQGLHLDHDRKNVPGSPDLVRVILDKIEKSAVFVADVTAVGRTGGVVGARTTKGQKKLPRKPLINANVAIELGYALSHVHDTGILMVMNEAYGGQDTLPFDLRHKAGPKMFNLRPDATKEQIRAAMQPFKGELKSALRDCLKAYETRTPQGSTNAHKEVPSKTTSAQYFDEGEVLINSEMRDIGRVPLGYGSDRLLYLRVIPTVAMPELREADIADLVFGIKVSPLNSFCGKGACHGRNQYGGLTYSFTLEGETRLLTSTQVFRNREIWGIDAFLLEHGQLIYAQNTEETLHTGLHHYIAFAKEYLAYAPPLIVEAGAAGVRGMAMLEGEFGRVRGTLTRPEIKSRYQLNRLDDESINAVLLSVFEDFFDAAGLRRPPNYRGFPRR